MKIRNGFVSNSSSSSFVVAFPENPIDANHIKTMLFGNRKKFIYKKSVYKNKNGEFTENVWEWEINKKPIYKYKSISTLKLSKRIFDDIKKQTKNDVEKIANAFSRQSMFFKFGPDMIDLANHFLDENKTYYVYTFNYGDFGDKVESILAYQNVFKNVPYKKIDNHICTYIFGENPYEN